MKYKKEEIYLDLSKCSEKEREKGISLTEDYLFDYKESDGFKFVHFLVNWDMWFIDCEKPNKTEITYPEFIKLFEGGESKEVLQVENNGWVKIESEKDLPKTFQELILYREDAGVFVGYYGNLAESLSEMAVEHQYNNGVSEETMWEEQFFYFSLEGNGILEGSEKPTHWMPLPEPPKF